MSDRFINAIIESTPIPKAVIIHVLLPFIQDKKEDIERRQRDYMNYVLNGKNNVFYIFRLFNIYYKDYWGVPACILFKIIKNNDNYDIHNLWKKAYKRRGISKSGFIAKYSYLHEINKSDYDGCQMLKKQYDSRIKYINNYIIEKSQCACKNFHLNSYYDFNYALINNFIVTI